MRARVLLPAALAVLLLGIVAIPRAGGVPGAGAAEEGTEQFGALQFPKDEHLHPDGWDFWWGAAELVTVSGNRYTVGIANDSLNGVGVSGHEVFPRQGPYNGLTIASQDGTSEWGHEGETYGGYQRVISATVPGVSHTS